MARRRLSAASGRALAGLAAATLCVSCARVMPPPGGERDEAPPAIVSITPQPMSTTSGGDEPVVIRFDERISERGIDDAVYVSPATGSVDIGKGRSDLEIRLAGGWQPGRVYRVVVRPVLQDLFNNTLRRPIEIVFSTGAPFSEAAAAGLVYERVTGNVVSDVRVEAQPVGGGAYHLALTDTAGIYRLPYLPPGTYVLRGYTDQNRDRRRDVYEPGDSLVIEVGAADTVLRPLALMRPDSSPANLTRVQVVDSVTLRLQLDDYMDVSRPQERASVRIRALPDSAVVELAGVWYPHALTAERARLDSIARDSIAAAADTLAADSLAAPPTPPRDTVRAVPPATRDSLPADTLAADTLPPDPLGVAVRAAELRPAQGTPLPSRELMVVLAQPLVHDAEYVVELAGVLNLAGVPGGGGTMTFRAPPAPPPPEPPADEPAPPDDESLQPEQVP